MKINLLLFGIASDVLNASTITLKLPQNSNVSQLKNVLLEQYPQLQKLHTYAIAVNEDYANDEVLLNHNDTVAIIPPVSGG